MLEHFLLWAIGIAWLAYTPMSLMTLNFFLKELSYRPRRDKGVPNNHFIFQIVTTGRNEECLLRTIASVDDSCSKVGLKHYEVWVITDEGASPLELGDVRTIIVPTSYETEKHTTGKARALQYACEFRKRLGRANTRTWVVLLDDDSMLTAEYLWGLFHAIKRGAGIAQGWLRMSNHFGNSMITSLMDGLRPFDCLVLCREFNKKGKPRIIHGEGLAVRADIETKVGWDFGGLCLAEDLIFGVKASRIATFSWVDGWVECQPPATLRELYVQRRRWLYGVLSALEHLDLSGKLFLLYRYGVFFLGSIALTGVGLTLAGLISLGGFLLPLFTFNCIMFVSSYQIGLWKNAMRLNVGERFALHLLTLLGTWILSALELGTLVYAFRRPRKFDVIRKV